MKSSIKTVLKACTKTTKQEYFLSLFGGNEISFNIFSQRQKSKSISFFQFILAQKFKKQLKIFLFHLTLLSLVSPLDAETNLRFAAAEWPPYTGDKLNQGGIAAVIVKTAFDRVGIQAEFMVYPWLRAQKMVKNGQLDGMGIAWYTEERALSMAYSQPYLKTQIVLIQHLDDAASYEDLSDLENKHFGILRGYGYLNLVGSESIQKTVLDNLEQSFQMLSKKRIDLTLEEKLNAHHRLSLLSSEVKNQIVIGDRPLQVKDLHLTISRSYQGHQHLISEFNRGLELIVKDGTYAKIIASYQPQPLGIIK